MGRAFDKLSGNAPLGVDAPNKTLRKLIGGGGVPARRPEQCISRLAVRTDGTTLICLGLRQNLNVWMAGLGLMLLAVGIFSAGNWSGRYASFAPFSGPEPAAGEARAIRHHGIRMKHSSDRFPSPGRNRGTPCRALVAFAILILAAGAGASAAEPPAGFGGSAYQKLRRVRVLEGRDHGPAYAAQQSLLDTCNSMRAAFYGAPPQRIDEAVLRSLDEQVVEKYYRDDRAATFIIGRGLKLLDFERWTAEQRGGSDKPAVPPDCARYRLDETRSGTIWRDGLRYQLDFARRRAVGIAAPQDFSVRALLPPGEFERQPKAEVMFRACRRVTAPTREFMDGRSCVWSDYPFAAWLNWPWVLEAESRIGLPQKMVQTDTLMEIERNGVLAPGLFDLPAGFSVTPVPR